MAAAKQYVVVVPLAIAKTETGDAYLYAGAPVPEGISEAEVARLLDGEFIAEADAPSEVGTEVPSDEWSNDELVAYATNNSIDLGEAKNKKEMLAVIAAAPPPALVGA